ncbi:MAG: L-histidine N(alpha)-methyltransferase [Saprospiraceae bacterium]|nr:L-histidine N(alpha)-methyltransferase [Saprospiraceae bacterium]
MNSIKEISRPTTLQSSFMKDVKLGLTSFPKYLPSKYFYDKKGDELFRKIMELPEYYLTRAEFEILKNYAEEIMGIMSKNEAFRLVELGAGDGMKTKVLLKFLLRAGYDFTYVPIDISKNALDLLQEDIRDEFPSLRIETVQGEYLDALSRSLFKDDQSSFVLFLGSSIGNFSIDETEQFFNELYKTLKPGDYLLTGWDLQKNPHIILDAYNDSQGVTRDFNLNLLRRINKDLEANFDLSNFSHYPVYDPEMGLAKSYLVANSAATYRIEDLEMTVDFEAGEAIFMEISRKYTLDDIFNIADISGFRHANYWQDKKSYFIDTLWRRT